MYVVHSQIHKKFRAENFSKGVKCALDVHPGSRFSSMPLVTLFYHFQTSCQVITIKLEKPSKNSPKDSALNCSSGMFLHRIVFFTNTIQD